MSFSPVFKLVINSADLSGSTVFYSDELSYKTSDGRLFSAVALTGGFEGLPSNFDMREYPKILFGITKSHNQPSENKLLDNTHRLFKTTYDLEDVYVIEENGVIYYSACGKNGCQAYVVEKTFSEQVFSIRSSISNHKEFHNYLKEKVHVEP